MFIEVKGVVSNQVYMINLDHIESIKEGRPGTIVLATFHRDEHIVSSAFTDYNYLKSMLIKSQSCFLND